jgi:hypothetical protein
MTIYIIYEIRPVNKELIFSYIGSTMNLRNRKYQHKTSCNNINSKGYNFKLYQFIRDNGGFEMFEMIPLEEYECDSKTQSRIREQLWIDKIENKLNMVKAYSSKEEKIEYKKEYNSINKEKYTEYFREYNIKNKEIIKERQIIYNEKNKEHLSEIKKKYKLDNKEKLKIHNIEYVGKNKEHIAKKHCEKTICCCSKTIIKYLFKQHERTKFHLNYLEQLNKKEIITECIDA